MSTTPAPIHLAVALEGAGWHPAAWREPGTHPDALFTAAHWTGLAREAERGLIDFLTIEDGLRLQSDHPYRPDHRTDRVRGRLDAVLTAARIAPATSHIGFVPTVTTFHTEPFHSSKAVATLDYVSTGRAGVRVQIGGQPDEIEHIGRRRGEADIAAPAGAEDRFAEAADYVEVLRRLWDSWEDDAEIRDTATGRFIDRDKLHYIDFEGRWFSVKGPSITPRPPQGQPLVAALGHADLPYRFIARSADLGFVTPQDAGQARTTVERIRAEQAAAGRADEEVRVFADLLVLLDDSEQAARDRRDRLDELAGLPDPEVPIDARVFAGTAAQLADLLQEWAEAGINGFRLRPAVLPHDLRRITEELVPELQRRGAYPYRSAEDYARPATLRARLGLPRPANRYAAA